MKFRNFKMVDYVVYGRGCFDQLSEIIAHKRRENASRQPGGINSCSVQMVT